MKEGFTLIELLVVVLIIGILSSVALPQYTKAVQKSRLARVRPTIAAMKTAASAYYLANGSYPSQLTDTDVEVPANSGFFYTTGSMDGEQVALAAWVGANEEVTKYIGVASLIGKDLWLCCGNAVADLTKVQEQCGALGYKEYIPSPTGGLHGCYKIDN